MQRSSVGFSLLALLLVHVPGIAAAEAQRFEIRSAYVELVEGVYLLNARLDFEVPEGATTAIRDGVDLTLDLEIAVNRSRRFWLDETVAELEQQYELSFHALSERYVVRNLNSGEQTSFPDLDAALESMSAIRGLPILDQSLIDAELSYEVTMRATVDVRTMPNALRLVLFWMRDFKQSTEWYTWPLSL